MRPRNALVIAAALAVALVLGGCSGPAKPAAAPPSDGSAGGGTIVQDAKDNASVAVCSTNRAQLAQLLSAAQSTSPGAAPSVAALAAENRIVCPSGGSFSLDAATGKVACSIHGE